jgi:hypothetical protein
MARRSRVGLLSILLALLAAPQAAFAQEPSPGDSVVGSGTADSNSFTIAARSSAVGRAATGFASFNLNIGTMQGPVRYLCVTGNLAVVSGVVESSTINGVLPGSGYHVHVADNGQLPTGTDLLRLQLEGFPPTACEPFNLISPTPVTSGDIAVTDRGRQ